MGRLPPQPTAVGEGGQPPSETSVTAPPSPPTFSSLSTLTPPGGPLKSGPLPPSLFWAWEPSCPPSPGALACARKCQGFPISEREGQLGCGVRPWASLPGLSRLPFQKLPAPSCLASCPSPSWKLGPPCPQPRAPIFPPGDSASPPQTGPLLSLAISKVWKTTWGGKESPWSWPHLHPHPTLGAPKWV